MKTHNCLRDAVCPFFFSSSIKQSGSHKQTCSLLDQEFKFSLGGVKNMVSIWFAGVGADVIYVTLHHQCQGLIEAQKDP